MPSDSSGVPGRLINRWELLPGDNSFNVLERPYYNIILAGLFEEAHRLGQEVRFFSFFEALTDPVFFNKNIHRDEISSLILILPSMITTNPEYADITRFDRRTGR